MAQLRPTKGDVSGNLSRVRSVIAEGADAGRDLIVFPETVLSGYFVEGGVEEVARTLDEVIEGLGPPPTGAPDVALGFYEASEGAVHNSAVYLTAREGRWQALHIHRKVFLPTYGVFQEARFIVPGREFLAFDTRFGRMGLLICEDMFHSIPPAILCLDGAQLLLCLAATPARDFHPRGMPATEEKLPGNLRRWDALGQAIAMEHAAPLLVSHLVGSEGGKLLGGGSVAYGPGGEIWVRGPLFSEASVDLTLDRREVERRRLRSPLLRDLRVMRPHLERGLARAGEPRETARGPLPATTPRQEAREPSPTLDPGDRSVLELDWELTTEALIAFLRDEIRIKRGFRNVVIGVSGGVDSAVSLILAARALGPDHVHAFFLPYATSSPESEEHGRLIAEQVGVSHRTIPITAAVDAYVDADEPEISDRRRGNLAARFRAMVLWDQSARLEALVLGTGNKSERLMGYFTWHADDSPPVNPLGDLYKSQVWGLARHLDVPSAIIEKPASADLVRGVHDETELGVEYATADLILHWLLDGVGPAELVAAGFDGEAVDTVDRHLRGTHWKRRLPTIAMVSSSAIGEFYLRPVDY